jgi:RHS repeat-associated protein
MKILVILVSLLIILTPISFAKEITIPELFEVKGQVISEPTGKGVYFYAGSKLIAVNDKYQYQDRLGSDFKSKTLPFGQEIINNNRFSFTGKELDEDLYYFGARYYSPELGKFTSIDPIEQKYPYSYTHNNPMNLIDPDGAAVGDPTGDGKVENLFGSPVSQGTYNGWEKAREGYDQVEANPGWGSKTLLWLHPDFDNFEDWHNSILATSYPEMYYNPNRGGGLDWNGLSGLEKTLLVANAAIYLVTVFGGPRAMAMQNRQTNPVRPMSNIPKMPTRSTPTRDTLTGDISVQSTLNPGFFLINRPGLSPATVNQRGLFRFLERTGTLIPRGNQNIRLRVVEDPTLNALGRMYNRKVDPIKLKNINPNAIDEYNLGVTPQLFADRYGIPVTSGGKTVYPRTMSGGEN